MNAAFSNALSSAVRFAGCCGVKAKNTPQQNTQLNFQAPMAAPANSKTNQHGDSFSSLKFGGCCS